MILALNIGNSVNNGFDAFFRAIPQIIGALLILIMQYAIPVLTGAVLVANARMGEQQRPAEVAQGVLQRLLPTKLAG